MSPLHSPCPIGYRLNTVQLGTPRFNRMDHIMWIDLLHELNEVSLA